MIIDMVVEEMMTVVVEDTKIEWVTAVMAAEDLMIAEEAIGKYQRMRV